MVPTSIADFYNLGSKGLFPSRSPADEAVMTG